MKAAQPAARLRLRLLSLVLPALAAWGAAAGGGAADVDPAVLQAEAQRIAVMAKAKDAVLADFRPAGKAAAPAWSSRPTATP